jgi:hypothetical protein
MTNLQIKILNIIDTYKRPLSVRKILSLLQTTHQASLSSDSISIPTLSDVSMALKKLRQSKLVDECRRSVYQRPTIDKDSVYEHKKDSESSHNHSPQLSNSPSTSHTSLKIKKTLRKFRGHSHLEEPDYQDLKQANRISHFLAPYPSAPVSVSDILNAQKKLGDSFFQCLWQHLLEETEMMARVCRIERLSYRVENFTSDQIGNTVEDKQETIDHEVLDHHTSSSMSLSSVAKEDTRDQFDLMPHLKHLIKMNQQVESQLHTLQMSIQHLKDSWKAVLKNLTLSSLQSLLTELFTKMGYAELDILKDEAWQQESHQRLMFMAQNPRQESIFILVQTDNHHMTSQTVEYILASLVDLYADGALIIHLEGFESKIESQRLTLIDLSDLQTLLSTHQMNIKEHTLQVYTHSPDALAYYK